MNNARLWLVVSPNVGLPILLGGVALSSFAVHVAVIGNTSWYSDYMAGKPLGTGMQTAAADTGVQTASATTTPKVIMEPATATRGEAVTVVMPDGRTAHAVFEGPLTLASSEPGTQ